MSVDKDVIKSHNKFFDNITKNKLNELLFRITNGRLQNDILNELKNKQIYTVYPEVKVSKNNEHNNKLYSIYINFYESLLPIDQLTQNEIDVIINKSFNNPNKIAHISIHLYPIDPNYELSKIGRIHTRNNRKNKNHIIEIKKDPNGTLIQLKLKHMPYIVNKNLEPIIKTAIDVLNRYFHSKSNVFLGKSKLLEQGQKHPLVNTIEQTVYKNKGKRMSTTRKRRKS